MPASTSYQTQHSSAQIDAFHEIISDAFIGAFSSQRRWVDQHGQENVRSLTLDDELIGGCIVVPFGHYFGGRRVSAVGISAVAVTPHHRAGGTATTLLKQVLAEQRQAGVGISSLYPATIKLYRRLGYELAGHSTVLRMPLHAIDARDRSLELKPISPADHPTIAEVYRSAAASQPGSIDRNRALWEGVFVTRTDETRPGYLIYDQDSVVGYVIFNHSRPTDNTLPLIEVRDWAALTAPAARRILTLLADHRTVRPEALLAGPPTDPMFALLGEFNWSYKQNEIWMLRIVHLPKALEERGYPAGLNAELHLRVSDDVLAENAGDWVLSVSDGVGRVNPGGRGEIAIDIRGLASLYAGFYAPADLLRIDAVEGKGGALDALGGVFTGPKAWIRDWF